MKISLIDLLVNAIEDIPDTDLDEKMAYMRANIIKDKYERLISEKVKEDSLTEAEYKRLKLANQSVTAIYKQVLGGATAKMSNNSISMEEKIRKIEAKVTLELPLNDYEKALWTLYGKNDNTRQPV